MEGDPLSKPIWLQLALCPGVVRRALKTALIVGPILVAINHGDRILDGTVTATAWLKMALTVAVPYTVATVSAVSALLRAGVCDPTRLD